MKNEKFQENLSRPGIINAKARHRAAARRLRNTTLWYRENCVGAGDCERFIYGKRT